MQRVKSLKKTFWLQNNGPAIRKGGEEFFHDEIPEADGGRDFLPDLIQDFQAQAQASLCEEGKKIMAMHAFLVFLGQLRFWMNIVWVARWNGLEILIPKHMWKGKIRLLEQK